MAKRKEMKGRMKEYLLFLPNLVRLLVDLLRDPRVSSADKAILAGTIIYVIAPIDVIPDFVPFIGQVDDAYLTAIALLRILNRAERRVIQDHWKGKIDIKELVTNISRVARFFLPKRMKNVLEGRIEPRRNLRLVKKPPAMSE
ncbi:MAG TPA: YkvA family protein [Blastocatellia bacterium]|nr:YkvA family protein [Blastocatellia bacterium]